MATQNIRTSDNRNEGGLVTWDLPIIRREVLQEAHQAAQDFATMLGNNFISSMLSPAGSTTENITQFCARGLTAKELVLRLSGIKDKAIKETLAEKILPYVVTSSDIDLAEQFNLSSDTSLLTQLKDLDDEKGDVAEENHSINKKGTRWMVDVYYAKALFKRIGKKHYLMVAYYTSKTVLPIYSLAALSRSNKKLNKTLSAASMLAFNKLHREMQFSWPNMIQLYESDMLPTDQDIDEPAPITVENQIQ